MLLVFPCINKIVTLLIKSNRQYEPALSGLDFEPLLQACRTFPTKTFIPPFGEKTWLMSISVDCEYSLVIHQ